jgi:hypothetical protein
MIYDVCMHMRMSNSWPLKYAVDVTYRMKHA